MVGNKLYWQIKTVHSLLSYISAQFHLKIGPSVRAGYLFFFFFELFQGNSCSFLCLWNVCHVWGTEATQIILIQRCKCWPKSKLKAGNHVAAPIPQCLQDALQACYYFLGEVRKTKAKDYIVPSYSAYSPGVKWAATSGNPAFTTSWTG